MLIPLYLRLLIGALLFAVITSSCSFNPPLQQKGEQVLQGIWKQDTARINKALVSYTTYDLTFDCDSFFVKLNNFSKVNYGADSCMHAGKWAEYARGTYTLSHDTLHLKGQYSNADRSLKKEGGCFRSGNYEEFFKIKKTTDSVYQCLNLSATNTFEIHRTKHISCIPKPL